MSKLTGLVITCVFLISFSANFLQGAEKKVEDPNILYRITIAHLADFNLNKAYNQADIVIRNYPTSKEAEKATLLKAIISTIKFQGLNIIKKKYGIAIRKAITSKNKQKNRILCIETTYEAVRNGEALVKDIQALLQYTGRPMTIELKKSYNSFTLIEKAYVPYKMLEKGYPPSTRKDIEKIIKYQCDVSYYFILTRLLYGPSPKGDKQRVKELTKSRIIKCNVNWAGCMMAMGDCLIYYAPIQQVGWIHPSLKTKVKDLEKAKLGYETAKRCFEKAIKSSKGRRYRKDRARARKRIKEIDIALKEIGSRN